MIFIGIFDEYTTLKFYKLPSKVHPLCQKSKIYDCILSLNFIFFFSFLGEHLDFLQDFNNLMVPIERLDEYTTLKFYVLHSKVHPLSQKLSICDYILSPKSILFFSFLGEHLDFLQDFKNLIHSSHR